MNGPGKRMSFTQIERQRHTEVLIADVGGTTYRFCECSNCGMEYAVPDKWWRKMLKEQQEWWCPSGCAGRRAFACAQDLAS